MNYIELLTQEEKVNLCGIMGGRDFKELFKHNERDFQKIRKGFRAKSLTEELALSIAIANVDKPFIASWVNTRVQIWLDEIHENTAGPSGDWQRPAYPSAFCFSARTGQAPMSLW